jgi:hypothetical protein
MQSKAFVVSFVGGLIALWYFVPLLSEMNNAPGDDRI